MSDEPKPPPDAPPAPPAPLSSAEAKVRAAMADAGLQQALRELDDSLHEPDPPAPDPVVGIPEKGEVLVTDTEAAAAYVQPMVRRARPLPQDTLTRVRVDARVEGQRRAAEAVRLAEDRLARARGPEAIDRERASRDIALLQRQFAEAEVTNLGLALEITRQRIANLQAVNGEREQLLARVLGQRPVAAEKVDVGVLARVERIGEADRCPRIRVGAFRGRPVAGWQAAFVGHHRDLVIAIQVRVTGSSGDRRTVTRVFQVGRRLRHTVGLGPGVRIGVGHAPQPGTVHVTLADRPVIDQLPLVHLHRDLEPAGRHLAPALEPGECHNLVRCHTEEPRRFVCRQDDRLDITLAQDIIRLRGSLSDPAQTTNQQHG